MTIKYGLLNDKHSWQDPVKDKDLSAPPGGEATGDRYLIATGASGDWADKAGNIGLKIEGGWSFIPPFEGMMVHVDDEDVYYKYTGSAWGDQDLSGYALKGANTDITSLQNAALYVGRDADNKVSWATDDQLKITIAGVETSVASFSTGTSDNDKLVTKGYTDDGLGTKLPLAGGTLSGDVNFDNNDISNIKGIAFKDGQEITWNASSYTLNIPTGLGPVLQIGQEMYVLVYNNTGVTIANGKAVKVSGVVNDYQSITLAKADIHTGIGNGILVTTMSIAHGSVGLAIRTGRLTMDTTGFSLGAPLYLSAATAGELTNTSPDFPGYGLFIGGTVIVGDSDTGVINVNSRRSKEDTLENFWNGTMREKFDFKVSSNGTTITGSLTSSGGSDNLTMIFSDGFTLLDVSTAQTIGLQVGSDTVPQSNYVYILKSDKILTAATGGWPAGEHIKLAHVAVATAARTKTEGALRNQNVNEGLADETTFQGHLTHITEKLRQFEARWDSGVLGSSDVSADATPVVTIKNTAGIVYQLLKHAFPTKDTRQFAINSVTTGTKTFIVTSGAVDLTSLYPVGKMMKVNGSTANNGLYTIASRSYSNPNFTIVVEETIPDGTVDGTVGDDASVVNHPTTPFVNVSDLATLTVDANGGTLVGKSFNIVVWGVVNKTGEVSHLMLNLPTNTYGKTVEDQAVADAENYTVYEIPKQFAGVGFLIARYTYVNNGSDWSLYSTEDLRGRIPNSTAGGGGGGTGVTSFLGLSDTPSAFTAQALSILQVNSGVSALEFTTTPTFVGTNLTGTASSLTAGAVTNATLTTALTVDTGTVGLTGNVADDSVLTLGAGASSISGANTGDNSANTSSIARTTNIQSVNETGIADGEIALFNLTNKDIRSSNVTIVTTIGADDTTIPTSKAVVDAGYTTNTGDMVLASVQSVTGLKTFDTIKLAVKGSSTGTTALASANASATDYTATLQAGTGTIAYTADITGTNSGTNTGDNAANTSIVATKLDDFTTPDDNTDLNANTTNHGLLVKATAPAAGLHNYVGIANGETAYTNKALFDATDPTTQAFGDSAAVGSAAAAARRDHKHAMMASSVYTLSFDNSDLVDGILTVSHALGVQYPHVTVYNNSHAQVIPDSISDGDELNSITVNLINYTPLTGTWNGRVSV